MRRTPVSRINPSKNLSPTNPARHRLLVNGVLGRVLIGYMRVSTGEQSLDLQRDALARTGCERIYDDVCSGRAIDRPGLSKALDAAREGDALVVWKLDRIGRSLPHVVGLVGDLQKRGVGLKVLTGDVDTTTATGRLVFGIFATLAEFERDLIHERTMAGLAAARARGRAGGRPRVMTKPKLKAAMTMMADRDNAARDIAAELGVSLSTLYAYVDARGQPRARATELLSKRPAKPVSAAK
jgi:DNA invertase Pin-like site-specific DNA recombinase